MPTFRTATVTSILSERSGLQRVAVDDERAYVLTQLTGPVAVGDQVIVNTTAVELGLGTGGWHVVHWNLSLDAWAGPGTGHIMKLRYTSLQVDTGAAEEHHPDVASDLDGTPVVVGSLHSQVPGVAATVRHLRPDATIVYVMTDGAALPMALSDLVVAMVTAGLVDATVTAGHAFGGDLEAVNVASALALAVDVLGADVVIVAMGPGVVGTGTALGTTALEVTDILGSVAALGGRPIACLRVSDADARARHRGVSHHTLVALARTFTPVTIAVPDVVADEELEAHGVSPAELRHHHIERVTPPDVAALLDSHRLHVTTMGREPAEEPRFFAACGAAGAAAVAHMRPLRA